MNNSSALQPTNFQELVQFATFIKSSEFVPKQYRGKPADIALAIQMGSEVGLKPIQALHGIAVINGRPSLYGDAFLAVIMSHPDFEDIEESCENGVATCTIKRRGRSPVTRTFSIEDAKKAGLWGKPGPWTNYHDRMLQFRARGFSGRDSFADALRGVIIKEEAEDMPTATATVRVIKPNDTDKNGDIEMPEITTLSDVMVRIEECSSVSDLDEIAPMAAKLMDNDKQEARQRFLEKKRELEDAEPSQSQRILARLSEGEKIG